LNIFQTILYGNSEHVGDSLQTATLYLKLRPNRWR